MKIERWLYRLLDLKAKAQQTFPKCRVEIVISQLEESPFVKLLIYITSDVDESLIKLDKIRDWWLEMPYRDDTFVSIDFAYDEYEE